MKKLIIVILSITSLYTFSIGQTCTSNPTTLSSNIDFDAISWTPTGGASASDCNDMADGVSTFTGTVVVDLANNTRIDIRNDVTIDGTFSISGGNGSKLRVIGGYTLHITGDLGNAANNGIEYTASGVSDVIQVDGTLYGKNSNGFAGSGQIIGGTLNVKNGTTCGSPCPIEGNFDSCTDGGDSFCTDNTVTPIVLAHFDVSSNSTNIIVIWSTASEENNDYFTIERSSDGRSFHELAIVSGAGNSFELLDYAYTDNNPFNGVSYYRLKQTDYDGTSETFSVVAAEFYGEVEPIKVIQQSNNINELKVYSNFDEENKATIYDAMGRISKSFILNQGENNLDLTTFSNRSGIYIIRVTNALGKELKTERFVIR